GTYLKALAAYDNEVPFYVAIPASTFDFEIRDGIKEIPIEERSPDEVQFINGVDEEGVLRRVRITPENSPALNYGFDITPAKFVTRLITNRGVCEADFDKIREKFKKSDA
ncbi:MAG: S-methyl-5-thioribose-1-phosphate isomerase, partial [Sulfurimonas sp.]|nr:S-methyl-5-thioribose-1-phosphate isomerase [Sulfurimonas sp.]